MTTTETNKTTGGPKSTALLGALLCGAALLPVPATAQAGTPDHDPRLVRAIALEETEHDTAAALKIYRSVQADPSARPEVRTRAALRAALAARAMGDLDVADAALRVAAQGAGSAAARARQMLQDPQRQGADEIDVRVLQLVASLRDSSDNQLRKDILFYGERAVPVLTRVVDGEQADMRYVQALAYCIWRTGGEAALAWLQSLRGEAGALKRRAVVAGAFLDSVSSPAADVFDELTAFLKDDDPMVRVAALGSGWRVRSLAYPVEAVLPLLDDADARVRDAARIYLRTDPGTRHLFGDGAEHVVALANLLAHHREIEAEVAEELLRDAKNWSVLTVATQEPAGRAALVALCALPYTAESKGLAFAVPGSPADRRPDELHQELLAAARVHGEGEGPVNHGARRSIQILITALWESWGPATVPTALELCELGYDVSYGYWDRNGDAAVHRALIDVLDPATSGDYQTYFHATRGLRGEGLDRAGVEALKAVFAAGLSGAWNELDKRSALNLLAEIGFLLASQPGPDAGAWAAEQIARTRDPDLSVLSGERDGWSQLRWRLFAGMTRVHDAERMQQIRALTMDPDFDEPAIRNYALGWLLHHGVEDPFELLQTALPMPLHALGTGADEGVVGDDMPELARAPRGLKYPTGVTWLCIDDFHPYSEDQVRAIVLRLLDTGSAEAWSAAAAVWSTQVRPGEPWLRDAMILRWEKCDRLETPYRVIDARTSRSVRGERSPTSWEQQPPSTAVLLAALGCLRAYALEVQGDERGSRQKDFYDLLGEVVASRPELREAPAVIADLELLAELDAGPLDGRQQIYRFQALDQLMSYQPERVDELVARFGTEDPQFRYMVFAQRLEMAAVDRVGLVREMLDDSYSSTRLRACGLAAELLTRDLVEPLIERLRDENAGVRTEAQQALEATRYYLEQQAVFRRLLDDEALGSSTSAAEALVRQVRDSGNELPIRVAAITSLGTLGVPETLPILIELMKAEQAELRTAATQAVERINSRTSELPVSSEGTGK